MCYAQAKAEKRKGDLEQQKQREQEKQQAAAEKRAAEVEAQRTRAEQETAAAQRTTAEEQPRETAGKFAGRVPHLSDRQMGGAAGAGLPVPGTVPGDSSQPATPGSSPPLRRQASAGALARAREAATVASPNPNQTSAP